MGNYNSSGGKFEFGCFKYGQLIKLGEKMFTLSLSLEIVLSEGSMMTEYG